VANIKKLLESFDKISETKNKSADIPAPRNVVAKNAKTAGAGRHKNPKEIESTRKEKHKKDFLKDIHEEEKQTKTLRKIQEAYRQFKQSVEEAKHFRTAYGWAGGSNEKTGKPYKHPEQIKAEREARKKEKETGKPTQQSVAEDAAGDLATDLKNPHSYNAIDNMMKTIARKSNITPKELHDQFVKKYNMTPDEWIKNENGLSEGRGVRDVGGGNPADKLGIRKQGVAEGAGMDDHRYEVKHKDTETGEVKSSKVRATSPKQARQEVENHYSHSSSRWKHIDTRKIDEGVAEGSFGSGYGSVFTLYVNTGEKPATKTKTKKFKREDDAVLWAEDYADQHDMFPNLKMEIQDENGNVVWELEESQGVAEGAGRSFLELVDDFLVDYSGSQSGDSYTWTDGKKVIEVEMDTSDPGTVYWALGIVGRTGKTNWVESGSDNPKDALRVVKNFAKNTLAEGVDRTGMIGFSVDTERAYQAVMGRYGDYIEHDEESGIMYVPERLWGRVQEVAHDADGIGAIEDDGYENPEHYGLGETGTIPTTPTLPTSATSTNITSATQQKPLNLQATQQQLKVPGNTNPAAGNTTNVQDMAVQTVLQKAQAGKPLDSAENSLYHSILQKIPK
jgi:hypothetical protein